MPSLADRFDRVCSLLTLPLRHASRVRGLDLEALEPRILLSGVLGQAETEQHEADGATSTVSPLAVVFIDPGVEDYQSLFGAVRNSSAGWQT